VPPPCNFSLQHASRCDDRCTSVLWSSDLRITRRIVFVNDNVVTGTTPPFGSARLLFTEERPDDRRDGVGVAADRNRLAEGGRQVTRTRDRRGGRHRPVRSLEGRHDVAARAQRLDGRGLGGRDGVLPELAALRRHHRQSVPDAVEATLLHCPVDGDRPQHTGVRGEVVGVGERADGARRSGGRFVVPEVGELHGPRPHEAPIARGVGMSALELGGGVGELLGVGGRRQHRSGLVAHIGRTVSVPAEELLGDEHLTFTLVESVPVGGDLGHADRHVSVIGPGACRTSRERTPQHLRVLGRTGGPELVASPECVASSCTYEDTSGPALLDGAERGGHGGEVLGSSGRT